jgi:AraC family transcriptional regulator, regulatory protein of adaptative response / DNA-3-methyladenine glycosylase II
LSRLFPTPEQLKDANLDGLGLTRPRARALKDLAAAVCDRSVVFDDDVENVVRALVQIPGIASWSAQYVALRGLGHPDAFPSSDLILRRVPRQNAIRRRKWAWFAVSAVVVAIAFD